MEFIDYDIETLYGEVREKAESEGAYEHEAWKEIVEDVLAGHTEFGELDQEELMELKEKLVGRFTDFEEEHNNG